MRRRILAASVAAIALAAAVLATGCTPTTNITASTGPLPDTVIVLGIGTGTAAPDQVTMSFGVDARAKTGSGAMDSCTAATNRIVGVLKAAGVEEKEIQTQQISLYPIRDNSGRKVVSYQATQSIRVTTKKVNAAGAIITAATGAGASDVSGPSYTMTSDNVARADSIAKAVADAKARATAMAKASGRGLGAVLSVQETPASSPATPYGLGQGFSLYAASGLSKMSAPTLPGQQDVQTQVSVVFRLN
jgi:uncharacterized protein YggE